MSEDRSRSASPAPLPVPTVAASGEENEQKASGKPSKEELKKNIHLKYFARNQQERPMEDSLELVHEVLKEVELEEYFPRIRDDLNLTRLSHFEHVKVQDFAQIGLGRPAGRRLLSAVKQKRTKLAPSYLTGFLELINPKLCGNRGLRQGASREDPIYSNVQRQAVVSCLVDSKDIVLKEKLGQGSFGEVRKAEWKREDGRTVNVAVKMLRSDALALPGAFADFVREVNAMIGLNHPNLIKLYGVSLASPYMIVQELAELGSVLDRLRKECSLTSVAMILEWTKQICQGMAYLESKRWIHRDLAARNVLLSALNKIKIGDFGLMTSIQADEDCYVMSEHKKIPFPWCAPECLKLRKFSHASDCWAYGVTLWEIFTFGEHPWAGNNGAQILQLIDQEGKRLPKPKACPPEIYSIMLHCWSHREQDRPTFAALTEFFRTLHLEVLKATRSFNETERLQLSEGDEIIVIDGQAENHWWTGQNKRTFHVGTFPRSATKVVTSHRVAEHISKPLRNSFIHAGHGDSDPKKSFGNPNAIDEIFLRNPVPAPDLLSYPGSQTQNDSPQSPMTNPARIEKNQNLPTTVLVDSQDVLLNLVDNIPPFFPIAQSSFASYGNDFGPSEVDYFNIPPGVPNQTPQENLLPTAPPYHYYNPSALSISSGLSTTAPLPEKPISYGNVFKGPDTGMLYSNVIMPTTSPTYSPNSYYNTATFVVRPAPPIPLTIPKPAVVTEVPLDTKSSKNIKVGKNEKVIKTYPVSLSIDTDPFDTTAVSSDLWRGLKDKLPSKGRKHLYQDDTGSGQVNGDARNGRALMLPMKPVVILPANVAGRLLGSFANEQPKYNGGMLSICESPRNPPSSANFPPSPGWAVTTTQTPVPSTNLNFLLPNQEISKPKVLLQPPILPPISQQVNDKKPVQTNTRNSTASSGFGDAKSGGMSSVLDDLLSAVQTAMPGESVQACEDALRTCHFDGKKAVKVMKVNLLLRLAVASELECTKVLEKCGWDVEKAGAALLGSS